jgi:hypothetical protein
VYKASRRREYERLRAMDEEVRREREGEGWEREKNEREERDRKKTRKNREKRERLKAKKSGKGTSSDVGAANGDGAGKYGGIMTRVDTGGVSNGVEGGVAQEQEVAGIEPVGLVIHDDD